MNKEPAKAAPCESDRATASNASPVCYADNPDLRPEYRLPSGAKTDPRKKEKTAAKKKRR